MTVDANKSAFITNATATPIVKTNSNLARGDMYEAAGTCAFTATAEVGSTYTYCRVPSNARVSRVLFSAADFTTAGAINVGIYQTADNGGAVVDADLFASALGLTGGPFANYDITFESGEYTYAEAEKPLWEVLGLSADPMREYDVVATVSTQFNAGSITLYTHLKVQYCE